MIREMPDHPVLFGVYKSLQAYLQARPVNLDAVLGVSLYRGIGADQPLVPRGGRGKRKHSCNRRLTEPV
jgi:hypothetical protein